MHHLYLKSKKVLYLWLELYFYYQRDNSITGKNAYTLKRLDALEAYEDRLKVIEECGNSGLIRLHIQQYIDVILVVLLILKRTINQKIKAILFIS